MKILLTGATGFVGRRLLAIALSRGMEIRPVVRSIRSNDCISGAESNSVIVTSINAKTDWSTALSGMQVVIHCAAKTVGDEREGADLLQAFRDINVSGTLNLAQQAAAAGVKRFIFISSIKVNGEGTDVDSIYTPDDVFAPEDAYAVSKAEAEYGLHELSVSTEMEIVVIRPPLIYGPGVRGNFHRMMQWAMRGLPFPLGAVKYNKRSLVALDNLVDLILVCVFHPSAANQTFLVSDGEDLSTVDLLGEIGKALDRPIHLAYIPLRLLVAISVLLRRQSALRRLVGSLRVDISKTCALLDWRPRISVAQGLRKVVEGDL